MRILEYSRGAARAIERFGSIAASRVDLADGTGEAHVRCIYFEPGGSIGQHPTGFGQVFLVIEGSGWVAGPDGSRVTLRMGEAAFFERGELHSRGSEGGMTAIMVQVSDLQPCP